MLNITTLISNTSPSPSLPFRDEQYHWIQNALNLRKVTIYSFGKMNFIHTVLSKRKLNWFVENNLVEGVQILDGV